MNFCIPAPDEWDPRSRVDLTFNLGDAIRYHREMTVPGIGGFSFVRQLSWAVMGISLSQKLDNALKANVIANGIEALGCKVEYCKTTREEEDYSFIGSRAFRRNSEAYLFKELSQSKYYVQNTYRQSIVTALLSLGFCESTRFNQMKLTEVGEKLKNAFGSQKLEFHFNKKGKKTATTCEDFLKDWVTLNKPEECFSNILNDHDVYKVLSPSKATEKEKIIVWNRLNARNDKPENDKERRIHLIELMDEIKKIKDPSEDDLCQLLEERGYNSHSRQIKDAVRFNEMRHAAIDVLHYCCCFVKKYNNEVKLSACLENHAINKSYEDLKGRCQDYISNLYEINSVPKSSKDFANKFIDASTEEGIAFLVTQENGIIDLVGGLLKPLNLFQKFLDRHSNDEDSEQADSEDNADLKDSQSKWKLSRLEQWCQLWEDAHV
jgi:hypothetical protein